VENPHGKRLPSEATHQGGARHRIRSAAPPAPPYTLPVQRGLLLIPLLASALLAQDANCTCLEGNGSYLFLRCPKSPPADPDPCPATNAGIHPNVNPPKEWNDACWLSPRMACFLRRHAMSWRISCTMCAEKKCCPFPNWANCPNCSGEAKENSDTDVPIVLAAREKMRAIGGKKIEVAMSPHYVFVTDLGNLKIQTANGGPRIMDQHEMLHLYLQRAEQARGDFERYFGPARSMRSMMILVRSEGTRQRFSQDQLGNAQTNLLYGGGAGKLVDGLAGNGFIISGRDDDQLHFTCRHMIGHLCISTYHSSGVHEKYLPQWIFRGAAHWLSKLHPRAFDFATFCAYEGITVSGPGSGWDDKAKKIAGRGPERDPVERMFQAATAKQMDFDMHVRSWSWFEIFLAEDKDPFVAFVQRLRNAEEARVACKATFGQAPEYVDDRWRERVLNRRRDVTATKKEGEKEVEIEEATSRELREIANEADLQLLSGKIRGLERCQNVKTARLLVSLLDSKDSDRVREVIALVLARTEDKEVLAYLRGEGFDRAGKLGRASLCRMFGDLADAEAVPVLRAALNDGFWLVKCNAMRALAQLKDAESLPALARLTGDTSSGKVRMAAMDALGLFGDAAKAQIPLFERNLMSRDWQMKVATCEAFKAIGSTDAVEMLIGRLDQEGGRVHDEIRLALKALTGMDRDWPAEMWRTWWVKAKKFAELEKKSLGEIAKEGKESEEGETSKRDGDRYADTTKKPPTYYGLKVYARAVGYVLDVSESMLQGFTVSEAWQQRLGRKYTANTRIGVSKEELTQAITELDPRTRLNVVFFNERVRIWQTFPVPAGAMGANAISAIQNVAPSGQTNYYDALKAILGMEGEGGGFSPSFADTPDTLFFLTDGTPTDGEITKADELLSWFNERNRFARLRVHVIAMGNTGVDLEFLSKLATMNGGIFVHMTGDH